MTLYIVLAWSLPVVIAVASLEGLIQFRRQATL